MLRDERGLSRLHRVEKVNRSKIKIIRAWSFIEYGDKTVESGMTWITFTGKGTLLEEAQVFLGAGLVPAWVCGLS